MPVEEMQGKPTSVFHMLFLVIKQCSHSLLLCRIYCCCYAVVMQN